MENKPPDAVAEWWELPDIREFYDESPDRGIAISLPAIVEDRLASILTLTMLDNKKLLNELFQPSGPLGTFGTKITLVYMMGIVNEDVYRDLKVINKIRNCFAHRVDIKTLTQPPIKAWIESMGTYQAMVRISEGQYHAGREALTDEDKFTIATARTDLADMRSTFRSCLRLMIIRLNYIEQKFTRADNQKSEPQS
jgi:DNA-binding MltR family transcriptional regulator